MTHTSTTTRLQWWMVVVAIAAASSFVPPDDARAQTVTVQRDIVYATVDGRQLALDLYMPAGVDVPPLAVGVHGGRWMNGDKAGGVQMAFVEQGIATASLDFRQPALDHDRPGLCNDHGRCDQPRPQCCRTHPKRRAEGKPHAKLKQGWQQESSPQRDQDRHGKRRQQYRFKVWFSGSQKIRPSAACHSKGEQQGQCIDGRN